MVIRRITFTLILVFCAVMFNKYSSASAESVEVGVTGHNALQQASVPPDDTPSNLILEEPIHGTNRSEVAVPPAVGGAIWVDQGPGPTKNGQVENVSPGDEIVGAIHTVVAHPTDPDILYIGAVNGGIWKTTNATAASPTWTPLTDALPALSIGAMEFDPTDVTHMTLVAGIGRYSSYGRIGPRRTGLLRTTDGGNSWTQINGRGTLIDENISGVAARGSVIVVSVNFSVTNSCGTLGIYHSVDGGSIFTRISGGAGTGLPSSRSYDLVGDPTNNATLYTVADCAESCDGGGNGIYKSTDTGATWAKVSNASMDALIRCGDTSNVEMAVGNSAEVYVAIANFGQIVNGGIFRSGDGGTSWTQMDVPIVPDGSGLAITNATNTTPIVITSPNHGIASGTRVNISGVTGNTAANGLFTATVLNANDFSLDGSMGNGAYAGGGQWTFVVGVNPRFKPALADPFEPGAQGDLHLSIVADPNDPNTVYIGGDRQDTPFPTFIGGVEFSGNLWRGDASVAPTGQALSPQWEHLTHRNDITAIPGGGTSSSSSPHADSREMVFDANGTIVEVDDGGIYRRTSPMDNTGDWFSIIGNLQTTEMHDVAYDTITNTIFGGDQDTANVFQRVPGGVVWDNEFTGGDGGDVAVDVVTLAGMNRSIRYTSAQFLFRFQRSVWDSNNTVVSITSPSLVLVGGGMAPNFSFKAPFELNAIDPTRIILGASNSTYESLDQGDTIRDIGGSIGVNDFDSDPIAYGGRSGGVDNLDVLYIGSSTNVFIRTSAAPSPLVLSTAYPGGFVRDIVLDPSNWQTAYVVDRDQRMWQTNDTGSTWNNITGNLSGVGELYSIEFMKGSRIVTGNSSDYVVVGSDRGVHVSDTVSLGTWNQLGTNLPNAGVYDLDYDPADDVLVASTMGRGVWLVASTVVIKAPNLLTGEPGFDKDRYVSSDPTTNGTNPVAMRVTRVGSTTDKYVDCTSLQDLAADGWYATLIDGPLPAPGDATYYCDFSAVTTGLHVRGCSVVPGNLYDLAMTIDGTTFSSALSIPTTPPQFGAGRSQGDTVGGFVGGIWTAPDGLNTANDIVAVVQKFSLVAGSAIAARVDTDGAVPNGLVSGGDILRAVSGFAGKSFGSGVTDCLTGSCVPPVGSCE